MGNSFLILVSFLASQYLVSRSLELSLWHRDTLLSDQKPSETGLIPDLLFPRIILGVGVTTEPAGTLLQGSLSLLPLQPNFTMPLAFQNPPPFFNPESIHTPTRLKGLLLHF